MIVYGINAVTEALRGDPRRVERIVIAQGRSGIRLQKLIDEARRLNLSLAFEPTAALNRRTGTSRHQGVLAEIAEIGYQSLQDVLSRQPRRLLLADSVEDPHNLGAVLRTAEAAGVDAVLVPKRRTSGITPAVVRASSGAALHLPICQIGNVADAIRKIKGSGFWTLGLTMNGRENLDPIDKTLPWLVVVGGESRGLRPVVQKECDYLIRLPMRGKVASLNLSVAVGVLLYQFVER